MPVARCSITIQFSSHRIVCLHNVFDATLISWMFLFSHHCSHSVDYFVWRIESSYIFSSIFFQLALLIPHHLLSVKITLSFSLSIAFPCIVLILNRSILLSTNIVLACYLIVVWRITCCFNVIEMVRQRTKKEPRTPNIHWC